MYTYVSAHKSLNREYQISEETNLSQHMNTPNDCLDRKKKEEKERKKSIQHIPNGMANETMRNRYDFNPYRLKADIRSNRGERKWLMDTHKYIIMALFDGTVLADDEKSDIWTTMTTTTTPTTTKPLFTVGIFNRKYYYVHTHFGARLLLPLFLFPPPPSPPFALLLRNVYGTTHAKRTRRLPPLLLLPLP